MNRPPEKGLPKREKREQLNVMIPADLIRTCKHRAIDDDVSMAWFVEKALRRYLTS